MTIYWPGMASMPAWCAPSTEQPPRTRRRLLRSLAALALLPLGVAHGQDLTPPTLELNRASRAELESLPGLGPAMASQLLARREDAPYADWQDLARRVRGMGPKLREKLSAAGLRVNGQAVEPAGSALTPASAPRS